MPQPSLSRSFGSPRPSGYSRRSQHGARAAANCLVCNISSKCAAGFRRALGDPALPDSFGVEVRREPTATSRAPLARQKRNNAKKKKNRVTRRKNGDPNTGERGTCGNPNRNGGKIRPALHLISRPQKIDQKKPPPRASPHRPRFLEVENQINSRSDSKETRLLTSSFHPQLLRFSFVLFSFPASVLLHYSLFFLLPCAISLPPSSFFPFSVFPSSSFFSSFSFVFPLILFLYSFLFFVGSDSHSHTHSDLRAFRESDLRKVTAQNRPKTPQDPYNPSPASSFRFLAFSF